MIKMKNKLILGIVVYFAFSIFGSYTEKREITPFFNWSLFSKVPGNLVSYNMLLNTSEGLKNVQKTGVIKSAAGKITLKMSTDNLGRALLKHSFKNVSRFLKEQKALVGKDYPFQLEAEYYSPVDKYIEGKSTKFILADFNSFITPVYQIKLLDNMKLKPSLKNKVVKCKYKNDKLELRIEFSGKDFRNDLYLSDGQYFIDLNLNKFMFNNFVRNTDKKRYSFKVDGLTKSDFELFDVKQLYVYENK